MSINRITATDRTSPSASDTPASVNTAVATAAARAAAPAAKFGEPGQTTPPSRFPWLNRLSQQLASASAERATFPAAPALGDHLDQSA